MASRKSLWYPAGLLIISLPGQHGLAQPVQPPVLQAVERALERLQAAETRAQQAREQFEAAAKSVTDKLVAMERQLAEVAARPTYEVRRVRVEVARNVPGCETNHNRPGAIGGGAIRCPIPAVPSPPQAELISVFVIRVVASTHGFEPTHIVWPHPDPGNNRTILMHHRDSAEFPSDARSVFELGYLFQVRP